MLELLQFVTSGFWTFVGCWIILLIISTTIIGSIRALVGTRKSVTCQYCKANGDKNGKHDSRS